MLGNVQILRFVAAALVVLFHVALTAAKEGRPTLFLANFGRWGECGVDMFFVISGLVMVLSQARSRRSAGEFLLERAIRIVPMYWLLTLLLAGLLLFLPGLFNSDRFSASKTLTSLFFVNGPLGEGFPVLYLGWTLEYEWIFYLIFSLSFALLPLRQTCVTVLAGLLVLNMAGLIGLFSIEFVYGMAIGLCHIQGFRLPKPWLFVLGGMGLLLAAVFIPASPLPRHLGYGIPALLIVAGLVAMPQMRGRLPLFLGAASYSIYLIQVFTIPLAFRVVRKVAFLSNDLAALMVVFASLLAGALAHVFVERPIARLLHLMVRKRAATAPISAGNRPVDDLPGLAKEGAAMKLDR